MVIFFAISQVPYKRDEEKVQKNVQVSILLQNKTKVILTGLSHVANSLLRLRVRQGIAFY
jgi:hypothetical protein